MRYTRPLSVCSEMRLRPSFLRTTPARKPRTECCCHSVAVMRAAIVAPVGVRSIARMRACLVSERVVVFGDERPGRERRLDLLLVRAAARGEAFDLGLDSVMGSSRLYDAIRRTTSAPPRAKTRQGKTPKRASAAPSHDSNARIKQESQSNLSNIVAPRHHKPATDFGYFTSISAVWIHSRPPRGLPIPARELLGAK